MSIVSAAVTTAVVTSPASASGVEAAATSVRVMTWNIHGSTANIPKLAAFIKRYDPDVLLVQEIQVTSQRNQVRGLAAELGWDTAAERADHVYFGRADHPGAPCGSGDDWVGNAIFTKFPIDKRVRFTLPRHSSCPGAGSVHRSLAGASVILPGSTKIAVWNTHLTVGAGAGRVQREAQARWIENYLDHTVPLVLAGDFNDVQGSTTYTIYPRAGWTDAGKNAGPTLNGKRIDYVWSKKATPTKAVSPALPQPAPGEPKLSDHRPVIVDLTIG
ncbi:hypothetical protein BLA60_41270 [Actinophytocola xinjiangensis]|uniref:Endonuclease/exonuclease/phosphatase domain-containing protein n=1 Tax=Actinophytocola xinjiangensis TaxID=485602 RepID=A0A7Z0WCN1_9PSEU|nr:hypothetical protein BLA60_41270 [Actinophytocola xinjiangensis]